MGLVSKGVRVDFIGSDEVDTPSLHATPKLTFLNFWQKRSRNASLGRKLSSATAYYARLISYAATAKPHIFHILWNNKFEFFDRTLLVLYYKLLGKKVVLTAHNVNARQRDGDDSLLNRLTLKMQYGLCDHIFVHTQAMKSALLRDFAVRTQLVTVIPYGINNCALQTDLTPDRAKQRLGIMGSDRTILFFGKIGPYKGLEYLIAAFQLLVSRDTDYRLVIAGPLRRGCEKYVEKIRRTIRLECSQARVIARIEYIPDNEIEMYFKAADVLVLPYTYIFQSGVLFLGYAFGLPVIASDVGSLKEDIIEGETGFLCQPGDPAHLALTIERYFESDLFRGLATRRREITKYANEGHSWEVVGEKTTAVYTSLLARSMRGVCRQVVE
jgi:glycosyltransferase involved in cell wall biosynthesis